MVYLPKLMHDLQQMGFFRYILPGLFIFLLFAAILRKIELFDSKPASILTALLASLTVVGWSPFIQGEYAAFLANLFGGVAALLILGIAFLVIDALLLGGRVRQALGNHVVLVGTLLGAAVLGLFLAVGGLSLILGPYAAYEVTYTVSRHAAWLFAGLALAAGIGLSRL